MPVPDIFLQGLARGWQVIDARELDSDRELEADVIIIGTGAGSYRHQRGGADAAQKPPFPSLVHVTGKHPLKPEGGHPTGGKGEQKGDHADRPHIADAGDVIVEQAEQGGMRTQ